MSSVLQRCAHLQQHRDAVGLSNCLHIHVVVSHLQVRVYMFLEKIRKNFQKQQEWLPGPDESCQSCCNDGEREHNWLK